MRDKNLLILKKLLNHVDNYNNLSPFPLWDSYYTEKLREKLKMEKTKYDEEPVECCRYCKNLHIIKDEEDNDICFKCGNIVNNDCEEFENIELYLKKYGSLWGLGQEESEQEGS